MNTPYRPLKSINALLRTSAVASSALLATAACDAASIAYSFSDNPGTNTTQILDTTTPKGPIGISVWNDSNFGITGTVGTGSESNLVNGSGVATGASISWSSSGTWYNSSDAYVTQDQRVILGYIDDGGTGLSISLSNIPYTMYNIYGIVVSDTTNPTYMTKDFLINGTVWALGGSSATMTLAFADMEANSGNGVWTQIVPGSVTGNYWKVSNVTGSTLTIKGQAGGGGGRGALAGIIIQEVPEPSALGLLAAGGSFLLMRRRKNAVAG